MVGTQADIVPRTGGPSPSSSQSSHHNDTGQWMTRCVWATSRRTPRLPAGRARTRSPAPGGNPCRAASPGQRRSSARGAGWDTGGAGEARSPPALPRRSCGRREPPQPPRLLLPISAESGAASSRSKSARGVRGPSTSLPVRGGAAGGAAPPAGRGAGAGGALALD